MNTTITFQSCQQCKGNITDGSAQCSKCNGLFHYPTCTNINKAAWGKLGPDRQVSWKCSACKIAKSNQIITNSAPPTIPKRNEQNDHNQANTVTAPGPATDLCQGSDLNQLNKIELMLASLTQLPKQLDDMRSELNALTAKINIQFFEDLTKRLDEIENKLCIVDGLKSDVSVLKSKLDNQEKNMKAELEKRDKIISELQTTTNLLEKEHKRSQQQYRLLNIELIGVPETPNEDLPLVLMNIAHKLNSDLKLEDIEFITRVQPMKRNQDKPKTIIAKLKSRLVKDTLIDKYKRKSRENKGLTSCVLGFEGDSRKIFVNEHLTIANKILLNDCREKAKILGVKFVWVKNCCIYARKDIKHPLVPISTVEDMNVFLK